MDDAEVLSERKAFCTNGVAIHVQRALCMVLSIIVPRGCCLKYKYGASCHHTSGRVSDLAVSGLP